MRATDHEEGGVSDSSSGWNDLTSAAVDGLRSNDCVEDLELHVTYRCNIQQRHSTQFYTARRVIQSNFVYFQRHVTVYLTTYR